MSESTQAISSPLRMDRLLDLGLKPVLLQHMASGKEYTGIGVVNTKKETEEWCVHFVYKDEESGIMYSRALSDFDGFKVLLVQPNSDVPVLKKSSSE